MSALADRVRAAFAQAYGRAPAGLVRAPGRVNLIGEHTDYNDGFVLPCAIGRQTMIAWAPRDDGDMQIVASDFGGARDRFALGAIDHHPDRGWRDYVRGMIAAMQASGAPVAGADLAIAGDIPQGTGLSSSASLMVAVGHAMHAAAGAGLPDPATIASIAQQAENDFVGVKCGIMDQLASAASVAGHALLIDCRSLAMQAVPLPAGAALMIIDSGVVRGLVEGHYNRRRAECEAAAQAMGVAALRDADAAMLAAAAMPAESRRRARHVISENARVLAAADALAAGDLEALGALMAASHVSMRDDFEITVPPIDALAALAHGAIGGAGGARMTGGGFGGAVVAVMPAAEVERVADAVRAGYRTPAGDPPAIITEIAAPGAGRC